MNEQIFPSPELVYKTTKAGAQSPKMIMRAGRFLRKPIVVLTVLAILVFTATPIFAANVPDFYSLMYFVSPATAQFFMPVQKSCIDNGIKMEVVSAYIHDDTAEIYITMQDLTGQRIDKTIDLYDSYDINRPFDCSASCSLVNYNEETKSATFLISITQWHGKQISGDKITFSVREFLSDKHEYDHIPISVDWSNLDTTPQTKQVSLIGGGGTKFDKYFSIFKEKAKVLVPSEPLEFPVEGVDLTGIGYVDGMLHIQTTVDTNKDNHGSVFLVDQYGNETPYDCSLRFIQNYNGDSRTGFDEYVFDIPKSEIDQYSLYGNYVTSGLLTQGNWRVTFPLETAK